MARKAVIALIVALGLVATVWFVSQTDPEVPERADVGIPQHSDGNEPQSVEFDDEGGPVIVDADIPTTEESTIDLGEGPAGLEGKVIASDGNAGAGAQVTLYLTRIPGDIEAEGGLSMWRLTGMRGRGFRSILGSNEAESGALDGALKAVARVVSGPEGEYAFIGLPSGSYLVAAQSGGTLLSPTAPIPYVEESGMRADVNLYDAGRLEGRIVGIDGTAVPGAEVVARAVLTPPEWGFEGMFLPLEEAILYVLNPIERKANTNREGLFVFGGLPGPLEYELHVSAAPWAETEALDDIPQDAPLEIRLDEGAVLAGRVIDGRNRAVGAAEVTLNPSFRGGGDVRRMFQRMNRGDSNNVVETNAAGEFRFEGVPAGTFQISVRRAGYQPGDIDGVTTRLGEETTDLSVTLERGGVIQGVVTGERAGAVEGVRVTARRDRGGRGGRDRGAEDFMRRMRGSFRSTTTDPRGGFIFDTLDEGEYVLSFTHDDWASGEDVEASTGGEKLRVTLPASVPLKGRLVDVDGTPVGGARVSMGGGRRPKRDESNAAGEFSIRGLGSDPATLTISMRGFNTVRIEEVAGDSGDLGDIVLERATILSGFVLYPNGEPAMGARVRAQEPRDEEQAEDNGRGRRGRGGDFGRGGRGRGDNERGRTRRNWRQGVSAYTDSNGAFRLPLPEVGDFWELTASHPELLPSVPEVIDSRGGDVADIQLRLQWGAVLSGTVRSSTGGPVVGADVSVRSSTSGFGRGRGGWGGGGRRGRTRGDGFFEIAGLQGGDYRLTITEPGYARYQQSVSLRDEEQVTLNLTLETERVLTGVVQDTDGNVVPGARIRASAPDTPGGSGVSRDDGGFEIAQLGGAPYRVRVDLSGYKSWSQEDVLAGRQPLVIVLEPTITLIGSVIDSISGMPIPGVRVSAEQVTETTGSAREERGRRRGRPGMRRRGRTNEEGVFQVEGLDVGEWNISLSASGYVQVTETVSLPLASGQEPEFAMVPGGYIDGVVVDFAGNAIEGVRVRAYATSAEEGSDESSGSSNNRSRSRSAGSDTTGPDGRFRVDGLDDATYRLEFSHEEYLSGEQEDITVQLGSRTRDVRQILDLGGEISGRVLNAAGQHFTEGYVYATGPNNFRRMVNVDENGHYRIAGLPEGSFQVSYRASRRGEGDPVVTVEISEKQRLDLDLRQGS